MREPTPKQLLAVATQANQRAAKALIQGNTNAWQQHTETAIKFVNMANKAIKNGY